MDQHMVQKYEKKDWSFNIHTFCNIFKALKHFMQINMLIKIKITIK
jgi:hypothetical protein